MKKKIIELPSIRDNDNGYKYLFKIAKEVMSDPIRHFDFNFKKCAILDQNAVVMLGALAKYVDSQNTGTFFSKCGVMFLVNTMSTLILDQLIKNNFLKHFSQNDFSGYPIGDYIGYREHISYLDSNEIANHLNNEWLADEKLSLMPELKKAVVSRILEIFLNAYGHAIDQIKKNEFGAISCGQFNKKDGLLKLTVLDFGIGIITNVKSFLGNDMSDEDAMKWALVTGHSTKTDSTVEIPRGLGFGLLNDFVKVNQGNLTIYSNSCVACTSTDTSNEYEVSKIKEQFNGTIVTITINCDDRNYGFVSELNESEQYF